LPNFYSYKVREPLSTLIVDDYYYPDDRKDFVSGVSMAFPSASAHSEERKVERDYPDGSYFHEFATDPLHTCGNSESSDSSQYRKGEGNILRCRCQHFCTEKRVKDFRRLIRLDAPELYFDEELMLKDQEDPICTE
jgi:hypothetical protein